MKIKLVRQFKLSPTTSRNSIEERSENQRTQPLLYSPLGPVFIDYIVYCSSSFTKVLKLDKYFRDL